MDSNDSPYGWTPAEVEAALSAYNSAPDSATKQELRKLMDSAREEVKAKGCNHRRITVSAGMARCSDCGDPVDTGCQHREIDNDSWQCRSCGEKMIDMEAIADTVVSAPNAAAGMCTIPDCDGDPAHGCTAVYVPDMLNQKTITVGWKFTYECARCGNNGIVMSSAEPIAWDCGRIHEGDYLRVTSDVSAATPLP